MSVDAHQFSGAYSNPVLESQRWFRLLMDGMSHPATRVVAPVLDDVPDNLPSVAAGILLALCDSNTPVWLAPELTQSRWISTWLQFHTGAPIEADQAQASYVVLGWESELPDLSTLAQGDAAYPERSATLIVPLVRLYGDDNPLHAGAEKSTPTGESMRFYGPGIPGHRLVGLSGLPVEFVQMWESNRASYPLGVDVILIDQAHLCCLPRSLVMTPELVD